MNVPIRMKRKAPHMKTPKTSKRRKLAGDYQAGRELARTPKQELKAFDIQENTQPIDLIVNPPPFNTLNALINGAELYQRVGRKIYMKSLHFRAYVFANATSVQDVCRLIIYYDSQPNAGPPTIAGIIQDSNAAAATTVFSGINLINRQRFKILRDKQFMLPSVSVAAGVLTNSFIVQSDGAFSINEFVKLKGLESVYNATNGGTVADITSGALGFVIFDDANNGTYEMKWQSRLRYYD